MQEEEEKDKEKIKYVQKCQVPTYPKKKKAPNSTTTTKKKTKLLSPTLT